MPVILERHGLADAGPGDLAVVRTGRGRARLERVLGPVAAVESTLDGLLAAFGHDRPLEPHTPPQPSLEGRVDLRELVSFTIDPETAKDFDDAVSLRQEGDGLRAWVHIADVSYFVPVGSPLDHGAARRGCSVYVPGRVAPMLRPELADDLCSLRPHLDRLCVTVEVPFDGSLRAGEPNFYRSVIRSRARLTYGQAERILAGGEQAEPEVTEALRLAERLTGELRRRRFERGALRIESPEVSFEFDGRGGVASARREGEPLAHALVEELMILANEAVAELLAGRNREALYRVHEKPDPQAIGLLLAKLTALEVPTPPAPDAEEIGPGQAAELAAAISERITDYVRSSGRGRDAFPSLVLRSLKQARYDPRNLGHSGLASRAYCHFTSPIRRYPDVIVHRALLAELGVSDEPLPEDLGALAQDTSFAEREAQEVELTADDVCLAWLLERRLFELGWDATFEGEIVGMIGAGLFVRFDDVFEGFLPSRRLGGDRFDVDVYGVHLVGRRSGGVYRLGDKVEVRVEKIEKAQGKVELAPEWAKG